MKSKLSKDQLFFIRRKQDIERLVEWACDFVAQDEAFCKYDFYDYYHNVLNDIEQKLDEIDDIPDGFGHKVIKLVMAFMFDYIKKQYESNKRMLC